MKTRTSLLLLFAFGVLAAAAPGTVVAEPVDGGCYCPRPGGHAVSGTYSGYTDCASAAYANEFNLSSYAQSLCAGRIPASDLCYLQYHETSSCTTDANGWSSVSGAAVYECWVCPELGR
jgi:hypothetical protein